MYSHDFARTLEANVALISLMKGITVKCSRMYVQTWKCFMIFRDAIFQNSTDVFTAIFFCFDQPIERPFAASLTCHA